MSTSHLIAKVQWSKSAIISSDAATQATLMTSTLHSAGDVVTGFVPSNLLVAKTYLILSEVSYLYVPTIGYVMAKSGMTLQDSAYTRPRQAYCVIYANSTSAATDAGGLSVDLTLLPPKNRQNRKRPRSERGLSHFVRNFRPRPHEHRRMKFA